MRINIRAFQLLLVIAGLLWGPVLIAAEITFQPDLVDHLTRLQRIYPAQAPSATLGTKPRTVKSQQYADVGEVAASEKEIGRRGNVISVKGIIKKGDTEKLDALLKDWTDFHLGIVFDSPGGNFIEGLKLAGVIREAMSGNDTNLGGVFVLKGGKCLSACALAFSGAVDPYHDAPDTRFIEDGANLGFHMGILPDDTADKQVRAGDVLFLAYDIVEEYTALISSNRNPSTLLKKALKHRTADSFYTLDAGLEAWAMGFSPVSQGWLAKQVERSVFDTGLVDKLCNTVLTYGKIYKSSVDMEFGQFYSGENAGKLVDQVSDASTQNIAKTTQFFSCHFSVDPKGKPGVIVWRGGADCAGTKPNEEHEWCNNTPKATWKVTNAILADALGCSQGKFTPAGNGFYFGSKRTGTIKRDVNMRETASLKATVVKQLKAGTQVEVTGCKIVDDSQGIWFAVTGTDGSGWTSARFVNEPIEFLHDPLELENE